MTYDYEEPGNGRNFWHIYSTDNEPEDIIHFNMSIMTIVGPKTEELQSAVVQICDAISAAIRLVDR